jgi:hypothetical protein
MVLVDELPSFARDVTDPDDHLVSLGVSENGVWVDFVEGLAGATYSAEFVTRAVLEAASQGSA